MVGGVCLLVARLASESRHPRALTKCQMLTKAAEIPFDQAWCTPPFDFSILGLDLQYTGYTRVSRSPESAGVEYIPSLVFGQYSLRGVADSGHNGTQ